jgi:hypothetical protein
MDVQEKLMHVQCDSYERPWKKSGCPFKKNGGSAKNTE